jgi:hypothetical protein
MFVRNDVARVGLGDHGRKVIGLKYVKRDSILPGRSLE